MCCRSPRALVVDRLRRTRRRFGQHLRSTVRTPRSVRRRHSCDRSGPAVGSAAARCRTIREDRGQHIGTSNGGTRRARRHPAITRTRRVRDHEPISATRRTTQTSRAMSRVVSPSANRPRALFDAPRPQRHVAYPGAGQSARAAPAHGYRPVNRSRPSFVDQTYIVAVVTFKSVVARMAVVTRPIVCVRRRLGGR